VRVAGEANRAATGAGAEAAASAARGGLEIVEQAASSVGELPRQIAQRSAESAAKLVQAFMDLAREQGRQNLEMLTTVSQAVRWDQLLDAHGAFLQASLERMAVFNRRYLEITQEVMRPAVPDRRDRAA
jgi:hypothetical protein